MPAPRISLNGPDNVGKTTQLRWLARALPQWTNLGTIDRHESRWTAIAKGEFSRWWFFDSTTDEHAGLIFSSHAKRSTTPGLALYDRGLPMLEAVALATAAFKSRKSLAEVAPAIRSIRAHHVPDEEKCFNVLLLPYGSFDESLAYVIQNQRQPVADFYAVYQRLLLQILYSQVAEGLYDEVIALEGRCIVDVQNEIRSRLTRKLGLDLPLLAATIDRLWLFGGLSESGKSTAAQWLHENAHSQRLKIGYLLRQAEARLAIDDIYRISEEEQAEELFLEIERFSIAHYWHGRFSLESLHSLAQASHLKRLLGTRVQIVYIDAAEQIRLERDAPGPAALHERDQIKESRGARQVKEVADAVLLNESGLYAFESALRRLIPRGVFRPTLAPVNVLSLPPALQLALERYITSAAGTPTVALIAITGSAGTRSWQEGWSDVDLLIIADTLSDALSSAAARLQTEIPGQTFGFTYVTRCGATTANVPPSTLHVMHLMNIRHISAQFVTSDLLLPQVTFQEESSRNMAEVPLVLARLRRLLMNGDRSTSACRAIYKHIVLAAKILLRHEGLPVVTDADVRVAATKHFATYWSHTLSELDHAANPLDMTRVDDAARDFLRWIEEQHVSTDNLLLKA